MNHPDLTLETEYHCPVCRTTHRSREDARIYAAHLEWNPRVTVRTLPTFCLDHPGREFTSR